MINIIKKYINYVIIGTYLGQSLYTIGKYYKNLGGICTKKHQTKLLKV